MDRGSIERKSDSEALEVLQSNAFDVMDIQGMGNKTDMEKHKRLEALSSPDYLGHNTPGISRNKEFHIWHRVASKFSQFSAFEISFLP